MATSSQLKIEKLCRTCLSKYNELNSLFDVIFEEVTLDFIVTAITGLKIRKGDGLPSTICYDCREEAEKAYSFKKKSQEAYVTLKGFYEDNKNNLFGYDHSNNQKAIDLKTEESEFLSDHDHTDQNDFSDVDYSMPLKNGTPDLDDLDVKIEVSKNEKPNNEYIECKKCCLVFKTQAKYQDHKMHKCVKVELEDSNSARCPCGTSYDSAKSLSDHMWEFHADVMGPKKKGRPKKAMTSTILSKLSENGFFIKSVHGKKVNCGFCNEQVDSKEELIVHMLDHSNTAILCCTVCKKLFLKKQKFSTHSCTEKNKSFNKTDRENTSSALTSKSEITLQDLLENYQLNASAIQVCSSCSAVLLSEADLINHHDTKHPELSLRCNHCAMVFASVKLAASHRRACKVIDRAHRCTTCGLKFAHETSLNKHILRYHQGEKLARAFIAKAKPTVNIQYQCDTCNKYFQRKQALAKHVQLHMPNQKLYECDICQKKFNRSSNLRAHKRIHNTNRPKPPTNHLCLYCGRKFSHSSNLTVHMRRHTGDKPYKCDFCEKAFPKSSDLMVHRRSHTGEKPCVCRLCGKAFSSGYRLSRHMRVHTGQKPYKCTFCEKAFAQSNDLTLHIRRHTGDRPYICGNCGDRFIQGTALQNHRRAHGHFSAPVTPVVAKQVEALTNAVNSLAKQDDSHNV